MGFTVFGGNLIRDVIGMDGGAGFANVAQHAVGIAMDQVAEIGAGSSAFAADAMAFGALELFAEKHFAAMFPIAIGLGARAAVSATGGARFWSPGKLRIGKIVIE